MVTALPASNGRALSGETAGMLQVHADTQLLHFVDGEQASFFSLPVKDMVQCSVMKNELSISMKHLPQQQSSGVSLCEVKFHTLRPQDDAEAEEISKTIDCKIKSLNPALSTEGNEVARLDNVSIIAPRGKYSIVFMEDKLQLKGKSFDHVILYESIMNIFCLPVRSSQTLYLVLNLHIPIKQSQSYYQYIGLSLTTTGQIQHSLLMSESDIESKYGADLVNLQDFQTNERMVSKLFLTITGHTVLHPSSSFEPMQATVKTNAVMVFFLDNGIMFMPKHTVYIPLSKIKAIQQDRVSMDNTYFDVSIMLNDGPSMLLSNVAVADRSRFFDYFSMHDIPTSGMPTAKKPKNSRKAGGDDSSSDDDDEEYDSETGEEEDEEDDDSEDNDEDDSE